jgi:hypothetical protein
MKKIAIIITVIAITSCKDKAIKIPENKPTDEVVNEAAMPYIVRELVELDNNMIIARDTTTTATYRNIAIDKIRREGSEYLNSATIDNIFSRDFADRLENQKKLITANCRQIERNKQYAQLVMEQFKK